MMTLYSTSFTSSVVVLTVVIAVINFVAQSQGNTSNQNPLDCVPSCRCSAYNVSCEGPAIVDDTNIRKSTRNLSFIGESINGRKMPLSMPFNLTTYPLLKLLNISNTGLRELLRPDFVTVTELEILLLTYNNIFRIEDLSFNNMNKLTKLDLSHNIIGSLSNNTFTGLNSLTILYLSDNQISNIAIDAFKGFHTLGFMYLSFNPLEYIEPGTFQNLSRLESLYLVKVKLANLEPDTFKGITSLKRLSTSDYRLCCLFDETDVCNFPDICPRLMPNTILKIAAWVIGWGALIGNSIVLVLRCRTDHSVSAKTQGLFIFNLAIADFLMGVYMIIISSADVYYGEYFPLSAVKWRESATCKVAGFIAVLSSETSVFILAIITIDRLLNVVFPYGKMKFRATSARVGVALIWTIAFVVSIVHLIVNFYNSGVDGPSDFCVGFGDYVEKRPSWVYLIALFLGVNFLIFILILLSYVVIFVQVRKSARSVANPVSGSCSIDRAREVKMATRMAIIVLTNFFCWMPVIIMGILSPTGAGSLLPMSLYAWSVVFILPINASINPYLYTFIAIFDGLKKRST